MKRTKEDDNTEVASQIQIYRAPFQIKKILKRRIGITSKSLSQQRIKKIKAFTWELNSPETRINSETLKTLMKQIKLSKTTRRLNLRSRFHDDLTDLGFYHFGNSLKSLNTIQDLTFDFYYEHKISSDEGLYFLCKGLKRLRVLKKLNMEFGKCHSFWHAYTFGILGGALKNLTSLEVFQLKVDFQFEIWWLKPVPRENRVMKIKPLFRKYWMRKDESLNEILKYLKNCHCLRSIWVSFFGNDFKEGYEGFCRALKKLISLQKVGIDFRNCLITDHELVCLCESLGKLGSLKFLSLSFENCEKISDIGINQAKEYIKRLRPEAETNISKNA